MNNFLRFISIISLMSVSVLGMESIGKVVTWNDSEPSQNSTLHCTNSSANGSCEKNRDKPHSLKIGYIRKKKRQTDSENTDGHRIIGYKTFCTRVVD